MDAHRAPKRTTDRAIRVFVSSTFRDMHAEREELVKRVFPQLRKLCESRGVTWGEVDLRWGVTDEERAEGEVLPICLAEIDHCRPYFIGLLGERYGWVPREIPTTLIEREGWVAEHRGRSVTEMEILHGVLRNPAMADHAFFYFRSPEYLEALSEDERWDYRERPGPEETERFGRKEAEARAEARRAKLATLKDRIRASGFPVRNDYPDPETLGELVLADLTGVIDRLFPEGTEPDPLDREAGEHEAFARSRAGVYVGRDEYFERLDTHVRSDGPPLVVLGESGSGKSALLANWAFRYRDRRAGNAAPGDELLLLHFLGASPASADWAAMVRRILGELRRRLGVEVEIPDPPEELRATFANALHMAAVKGRVVLILDALNQLEDRDQAPDLPWLPPVIPENVRLIVSTLPGRPLDELTRRGWPTLEVEPLEPEERGALTVRYLAQYTKKLSDPQAERIVRAPQTGNPLFLRALLEELRLWGEHETLAQRIEHYLSAPSVDRLYEKILARYEADYERDRPGLVRDAMSVIWAARRGLTEAELLDLLGRDEQPLPAARWSPLYLAAEHALVSRSGFLGFFHDNLRQAVQYRYLPGQAEQQAMHQRLADYFEAQELGHRKVDELPWQLAEAGAWNHLAGLLADPPFFARAWGNDHFEVKAYWARVEAESENRLRDAYRPVLAEPQRYLAAVWAVACLLHETGHLPEAGALWKYCADEAREIGVSAALADALGRQAIIARDRGRPRQALVLHEDEARIFRALGDRVGLLRSISNQGIVNQRLGDVDRALEVVQAQIQVAEDLRLKDVLAALLNNQAVILTMRGALEEARKLLQRSRQIYHDLGDRRGPVETLVNEASVCRTQGQLGEALKLLSEAQRIYAELGDRQGLAACLGNQASIHHTVGALDRAGELFIEQERIAADVGDNEALAASLGGRASILMDRGEFTQSLALFEHQERLYRESEDFDGLQKNLGNRALVLKALGNRTEAYSLLKEQEEMCRRVGNRNGLQASILNQAVMLEESGTIDEALSMLQYHTQLCRSIGDNSALATSLGCRALLLTKRGDLARALDLHREEEELCRHVGDVRGLAISCFYQGEVCAQLGDRERARYCWKEALVTATEAGLSDLAQQIERRARSVSD